MMHEGNYDCNKQDNSQRLECTLDPCLLMKEEIEQAPSWKQDSILGRTMDFELYAQYLWKDGRVPGLIPRLSIT